MKKLTVEQLKEIKSLNDLPTKEEYINLINENVYPDDELNNNIKLLFLSKIKLMMQLHLHSTIIDPRELIQQNYSFEEHDMYLNYTNNYISSVISKIISEKLGYNMYQTNVVPDKYRTWEIHLN